MYTAGMSGGARVALAVALGSPHVAGVIASSAGYPDGRVRKTLPFPLFETAGTEDFNHLEMRQVDAALTTPHHLAIFEGGHMWLSSALATEAVEWMEVQAMKSGLKARDPQELGRIFARRLAGAAAAGTGKDRMLALQSIVADFDGLEDAAVLSPLSAQAAALERDPAVRDALKQDQQEDEREQRMVGEMAGAEERLDSQPPAQRLETRQELVQRWKQLAGQAQAPEDSADRRLARRVLAMLSATVRSNDADYLEMIRPYRVRRGGRGRE